MKILLTGGTGFVGKNILPILREKHNVDAPTRKELDIKNQYEVESYLKKGCYDVVIHSANTNPTKNPLYDNAVNMTEDTIRGYLNISKLNYLYEKMFYIGSGAEYGKSRPICKVKETDIGEIIPEDSYGIAKYIINELANKSKNIYNFRVFGCYGPYDHESKFITHVIRCILNNQDVTIRQNCMFDYLHVYDLGKVLNEAIEKKLDFHDYNVASGVPISLGDIASKVCNEMNVNSKIIYLKNGWNLEYTANINRLKNEFQTVKSFISIDDGIRMQIEHERTFNHKNKGV